MPLQPTDVPSRAGIQAAIDEAVDVHASTTDTLGQHYDSGWQTPTLSNGWVHHSTPLQYRKIGNVVHFRGAITGGTVGQTTTAVTVPAGFAPGTAEVFGPSYGTSNNSWANAIARTSGIINISSVAGTTSGTASQPVWLSGISYVAA